MSSIPRSLIVAADWSEAQQFTRQLEQSGFHVLGIAATGADALRYYEELRPDLVLIDIDLAGPVDGVELIVPFRAIAPTAFVFVAKDPDDPRIARLAEVDASSLAVKPIDDIALAKALSLALHRRADKAAGPLASGPAFDAAPDAMLLVGSEGRIERINAAFERQFGYTAAQVEQQPIEMLLPPAIRDGHAQHRAWFADHPQVRRMGERQPLVARRADGSEFPVDISLVPFGSGAAARVLAIVRDTSERRLLQEAQRERLVLEEQLGRVLRLETVGRLAGGIAHDFNNLLMVIGGYIDVLLAEGSDATKQRRLLEGIRTTTNRATELTRQLLAFGRRQVLLPKVIDVAALVDAMHGLMSRVIGESIDIEKAIAHDVKPVRVDTSQLEQVLLNLALNARDAMPGGGTLTFEAINLQVHESTPLPHLSANTVPCGDYVRLAVRDTGCGMSADTAAKAFEPFFSTKGPGKGIGMGLASVYGIVKQSGGFVWIESEPGSGTNVVLLLPASAEAAADGAVATPPPDTARAARILLVEDEADVRDLLKEALETSGFEVIDAANGRAALEIFRDLSHSVDLIVTDVMMPKCGGLELVREIRRLRPGLPAIFMSGYSDDTDTADLQSNVATAFLQKPFATEYLRQKVAELLAARGPHAKQTSVL